MKLSEAIAFVGIGRRDGSSPTTGSGRWLTIDDVHRSARRRLPRGVMDYVDGGADREESLGANEEAFRRVRWVPRGLSGAGRADTATTIAGAVWSAPLGLAPTGYTRMIDPDGEVAVARAAGAAGVPYTLSTVGSTTIETIADEVTAPWSQLYVTRDRGLTDDLIRRADETGAPVLEIAIDVAVGGNRLRDVRNGLSLPPRMTASTLWGIAVKPRYWTRVLRHPAMDFLQIRASDRNGLFAGGSIADISRQFEPALSWADIERIREQWPRTLLIKGLVNPEDAARAKSLGVDGVHLSNHGGRQLDQSAAPIDLVPSVRAALGDDAVLVVDSGVRSGSDIALAVARGADAAFVGRPYLWALAGDGGRGVARMLDILRAELERTMVLVGVETISELRARGPQLLHDTEGPS